MQHRYVWPIAVVILILTSVWLLPWLMPFPVRAYERLQVGMTAAEIEAVIGLPPGDYSGRDSFQQRSRHCPSVMAKGIRVTDVRYFDGRPSISSPAKFNTVSWTWEEYGIVADFDESKEGDKAFHIALRKYLSFDRPSLFDRLKETLGTP